MIPVPNYGIVLFGSVETGSKNLWAVLKLRFSDLIVLILMILLLQMKRFLCFDNIERTIPDSFTGTNFNERILNIEAGKETPIVTLETVYLKKKILKELFMV